MQYDHFINYVRNTFEQLMGPGVPVRIQPVLKNNSVRLDALTIQHENQAVSPSIYLNDYYRQYEEGTPLNTIIQEISDIYEASCGAFHIDTEMILNFSCARNLVAYKLVNYEANRELLETIPYVPYLDLAIIFYLLLDSDAAGDATAIITNEHLSLWKTDLDTIYALAAHNTPILLEASFMSLENLMRTLIIEDLKQEAALYKEQEQISDEGMLSDQTIELMAEEILNQYTDDETHAEMFVLTNSSRCNGAAVLLYDKSLEQAADRIGGSFYILPSSIHEVILLPAEEDLDPENLANMVREINDHDVAATEKLSDTIYYYDAESCKIDCIL
ncbi:MAG: DUF5688 family protein [Lachnospiraceae bacterium]|nr:DUF5688 family protein [Lachnospiraceae bacterium]MDY4971914.1 DUF5688 family protein [Lachnospiraceae bacterium]